MAYRLLSIFILLYSAQSFSDVADAREALSKNENDDSQEKSLEEVFEATENIYSLMKMGNTSLNYALSYSYSADQRIDVLVKNERIYAFDVNPSAAHSLSNNFSFSYGYKNNLTLGMTLPMVTKYDSVNSMSGGGLGDVSFSANWQPFAYVPGEITKTFNASFKTKTGDSPYTSLSSTRMATGSGYYSISGGLSASKVIDPVMLFGSTNLNYAIPEKDVNQPSSGKLLQEVRPGVSVSLSGGFGYALSYDVTMTLSFQGSYTDKSTYVFNDGAEPQTNASMSGIINMGLGIRISPKTITNVGIGFGMTDDAPDILMSFSMPIDVKGLKPRSYPASS